MLTHMAGRMALLWSMAPAVLLGCVTGAQGDTEVVPADWVRLETPCDMRFAGPQSLTQVQVQGTDSCVLQFEDDDCVVGGGRGGYSSTLSAEGIGATSPYTREPATVDGREASFVVATTDGERPFFVGVHVPLGASSIGPISAELYAYCSSTDARDAIAPAVRSLEIDDND